MSIKFTDSAVIGDFRDTDDGYRVALSRIARTGIQKYHASELGMIGDGVLRVNRAPEQVFAKDTFKSLAHVPVTVDHPQVMVGSDNWAELAKGEVGNDVLRDGEWLAVPLILKDASAIEASQTTHKEISMGYTAKLIDAPEGADYDLDMTDIKFNHLALVPKGRAGSEARIGDSWGASPLTAKKEVGVTLTTVMLGDKAVKVDDADAPTVSAILADHKTKVDAKDSEIGELKAKLADAESKILTDEQLAEKVTALADAKAKRDAVTAHFGDESVKDASDAEIAGMFKVMGDVKSTQLGDAVKGKVKDSADPWAKFHNKKEV